MLALMDLGAPVVTAVQGAAAGAGLSLVCASDLAVAAESATFTVAYTSVGLSPDGGSSWLLPRLIGQRRAAEMMIMDRRVKAEAYRIGLVSEVVPDRDLEVRARDLANRLASGATASYAAIKRLLHASATATLRDQMTTEAASIARLAASPTGVEGVQAFIPKRAPIFPASDAASSEGAGGRP